MGNKGGEQRASLNGLGRKIKLQPLPNKDNIIVGIDDANTYMQEGQFANDLLEGFGRRVYASGESYLGWLTLSHLNGYAELRKTNGVLERGLFRMHKYQGDTYEVPSSFADLQVRFAKYIRKHKDAESDIQHITLKGRDLAGIIHQNVELTKTDNQEKQHTMELLAAGGITIEDL